MVRNGGMYFGRGYNLRSFKVQYHLTVSSPVLKFRPAQTQNRRGILPCRYTESTVNTQLNTEYTQTFSCCM